MGNFATSASKLSSEDRFAASSRAASITHPIPLTHTASTGGPTGTRERTRSKQGEKRNKSSKSAQSQIAAVLQNREPNFEPVAPLQVTANRWDKQSL
jgi:translation initiation factor 4G